MARPGPPLTRIAVRFPVGAALPSAARTRRAGLKWSPKSPDSKGMATDELDCPICSADIPLAGDERKGDELICHFCGAPFRLLADVKIDEEVKIEDEF